MKLPILRGRLAALYALPLALALPLGLSANAAGPQQPEGAPLDPEAVSVMSRAWSFLGELEAFTVGATAWSDVALDDDETIQYESRVELALRRPDRLQIRVRGDVQDRGLWINGEEISVLESGYYATVQARKTIAETLALLDQRYEVRFPLQDLALDAASSRSARRVRDVTYLGRHTVGGRPCHHVVWSEPDIDVQVWIDARDQPLPRRIVVEHKTLPNTPRYQISLHDWDLAPNLPDDRFRFTPPEGATQIEIVSPAAPQEEPR